MVYEELCRAVDDAFENEQVPFLKRLVDQPSHTLAKGDVEEAALLIESLVLDLGMRCRRVPDPDGVYADHRVYQAPATGDDDRALALVGHCDTVYPREQGFLTFEREGNTIRGPGVLDMKSGLSEILFALQAVKQAAPDIFAALKVRFICNTDEEVGSPSSKSLYDAMAALTSRALVFEGGREADRIITCRKGTGMFQVTALGVEAHAGNFHEDGVNAIHALSLLIPRIEALTDYEAGTTLNVGLIEGGTAKNTVPGKASCVLDVRLTTLAEAQRVETAFQEMVAEPELPEGLQAVRFELSGGIRRQPMEPTEGNQQLREDYEVFAAAQGLEIGEAPLQGGGSDANLLAAHGVPVIDGLGPYGKFLHSINEWSSLDSLQKRTRALACFLVSEAAS